MIWTKLTHKQVVVRRIMVIDVVCIPQEYILEARQRWCYIAYHVALEVGSYLLFMALCIFVVGLLVAACGYSEAALGIVLGSAAVTAVEAVKRSVTEWKYWSHRVDRLVERKV